MAQDTGGAIKGAVRADFFWGFGKEAGEQAGRMKQSGRMWVLLPAELRPNRRRSHRGGRAMPWKLHQWCEFLKNAVRFAMH
jgi:hypothetical protein